MAKQDFVRTNEKIKAPKVLLIHEGKNVGVVPFIVALNKAKECGLDLVEVSPNAKPPVCSIMDFGKYMYEKQKKQKNHSVTKKEKEVSFRYVISDHDLETKGNQIKGFLEKGNRVKIVVKFKAREKAHKDQGMIAANKLINMVKDLASVEKSPSFEGSSIIAILEKKKEI